MSAKNTRPGLLKTLSVGGGVILTLATPINLFFIVMLLLAGQAVFNEQIILVGVISTLALFMAAIAAALLAMIVVGSGKSLSQRGFVVFLVGLFVALVLIWMPEIFRNIAGTPWLYVAALSAILLACSLVLVPRLRALFVANGVIKTLQGE